MPTRPALIAHAALTLLSASAQFHRVPVPAAHQIVGEQSTNNGAMWALTAPLTWGSDFPSSKSLTIARTTREQPMLGFGAAFTDTSGWNYMKMNATTRAAFLEAGWGETGAGWTLMRVTINSADYSFKSYAYDSTPDDFSLAHFDHNLTYDKVNVQPFIKGALAVARAYGADIKMFASPWSPPGWMKTNNQQDGCSGPNSMKPDSAQGSYLQAWASYMSAWLTDYAASGLPMWGACGIPYQFCWSLPFTGSSGTDRINTYFSLPHVFFTLRIIVALPTFTSLSLSLSLSPPQQLLHRKTNPAR